MTDNNEKLFDALKVDANEMTGSVFNSGLQSIILRMLLLHILRPHISCAKSGFLSLGLGPHILEKLPS